MTFDRDIPIPGKASRWDFTDAEPGCSKGFTSNAEALSFAQSAREYSRRMNKGWGTLKAPDGDGWRVWITQKREMSFYVADEDKISRAHQTLETAKVLRRGPYPVSTETDDDIGLSFDPRRGDALKIARLPEANPVEVEEEVTPTGRRKRSVG